MDLSEVRAHQAPFPPFNHQPVQRMHHWLLHLPMPGPGNGVILWNFPPLCLQHHFTGRRGSEGLSKEQFLVGKSHFVRLFCFSTSLLCFPSLPFAIPQSFTLSLPHTLHPSPYLAAEYLGFPSPPPSLQPGADASHGLNFASAGATATDADQGLVSDAMPVMK